MIGEVMAEPHVEDERPWAIEHPRGVEFQLSAPTIVVLLSEISNLGFGIGIEHLAAQVHIPPVEERTVIGRIKPHFVIVDAIFGDCVLRAVIMETGHITDGIAVIGIVEHGVESLETIAEFGVVRRTWHQIGVARHIVAGCGVVTERVEIGKVRSCDAHGIGQR